MHMTSTSVPPSRIKSYDDTFQQKPFWFRQTLGRVLAPSRQQWRDMETALSEGDPTMDAWVTWMFNHNPKTARDLFDQALHKGIESIDNPPAPLAALFAQVDNDPPWLDRSQFETALSLIHRTGNIGQLALRDVSLMGGYLLSDFNQALVLTGALTHGASKRLAETGKWWFDVTQTDGMQRYGVGFTSTLHVRLIHALVRRNLPQKEQWQSHQWGLPINQLDMAATSYAFSFVFLLSIRCFGIPVTPKESAAVMHLWKYIGWLMGIDEKWLEDNEIKAGKIFYQLVHAYHEPDWTSVELGQALAEHGRKAPLGNLKDFPKLQKATRELIYQIHLSSTALFINKKQRSQLGLPSNILPWYPLLTAPPRFAWQVGSRLSPSLRKRSSKSGRQRQENLVMGLSGSKRPTIMTPDL